MVVKELKALIDSKVVYLGPIGFSGELPKECLILKEYIEKNEDAEEHLKNALVSNDSIIICYSLVGLSWIKSDVLNKLPGNVFSNTNEIAWQMGSVRSHGTVGEFAKMMAGRLNDEINHTQTFAQKNLENYLKEYKSKKP